MCIYIYIHTYYIGDGGFLLGKSIKNVGIVPSHTGRTFTCGQAGVGEIELRDGSAVLQVIVPPLLFDRPGICYIRFETARSCMDN